MTTKLKVLVNVNYSRKNTLRRSFVMKLLFLISSLERQEMNINEYEELPNIKLKKNEQWFYYINGCNITVSLTQFL